MRKIGILALLAVQTVCVQASWYWPFGSEDGEVDPPRISELMEPATTLIDEAADLAADGKTDESVEKYRKALIELDRVEMENPERAKSSEFATLRNKRAYVNAAIDSMLLSQVRENAKAVAVSDTTELEKRLKEERESKAKAVARPETKGSPKTKREQAMAAIAAGDFAVAEPLIREMLAAKPNSAMALNLKASMEARQGKFEESEQTLNQAIGANPNSHFAYYNMANLLLQKNPADKAGARRFYEAGRAMGGPRSKSLEEAVR